MSDYVNVLILLELLLYLLFNPAKRKKNSNKNIMEPAGSTEQPKTKKRKRDIEVHKAVRNPVGPGFVCYYCNRENAFHSEADAEGHYKICHFGPIVIQKNWDLGYIYQNVKSYVCVQCGNKLKSKNAIIYHMKTHQMHQKETNLQQTRK